MEYVTLSNGVKVPKLGYGVFLVKPEECERCVSDALKVGYRHIDTAQAYYNEEGVGNAIAKSGIPRNELFLTTKVWITNAGYEKAKASIDESLKKLQTDYIDLLLIHQPFGDYYGTWRAMEEYYKAGKLKAIGVSNFLPDRLVDLCNFVEIKPMVDQVEIHAFDQQKEAREIMKKYGVVPMAWSPLGRGENNFFTNEVLVEIGKRHKKTTAQVGLRFLLDENVISIPKSTHKERMEENLKVFDFKLDEDDKKKIEKLDLGKSLFVDHRDPSFVEYIVNYDKNNKP